MRKLLIIPFLCLLHAGTKAQKVDFIKLINGVLYYSIKGEGKTVLLLSGGPGTSANILDHLYDSLSKGFSGTLFCKH